MKINFKTVSLALVAGVAIVVSLSSNPAFQKGFSEGVEQQS